VYRACVHPSSRLPEPLGRLPDRLEQSGPPERASADVEAVDQADAGRVANPRVRAIAEELEALRPLEEQLGYRFSRPALLRASLTLASWANEHRRSGWPNNDCLEFFGDAVLGLVAAELVWRRFGDIGEGELTRLRASLVSETSLAAIARAIDLGAWLYLGKGEQKHGGRDKPRLLADTFEAVLGAVYLDARDAGIDPMLAAEAVLEHVAGQRFRTLVPRAPLDAKSRLQHHIQAIHRIAPVYVAVATPTSPGEPSWRARVELRLGADDVRVLGEGEGRSLRDAEQAAAAVALAGLELTKGSESQE